MLFFRSVRRSFCDQKCQNTVLCIYVISDLNNDEIAGTFYEKELQKTNHKDIKIKEVIRRKGDKTYAKWLGHDNLINSCVGKKKL